MSCFEYVWGVEEADGEVVQISFGSLFWPVKTPEQIWAFLDVVMERGIPFVSAPGGSSAEYT